MVLGALIALVAVVLGAFGAHGLEERLTADQLADWRTGVRYLVWHALALCLVGTWLAGDPARRAPGVAWAWGVGSAFFSGSIFALCLGAPASAIWWVTPLGGLLLIVGWALLAVAVVRTPAAIAPESR